MERIKKQIERINLREEQLGGKECGWSKDEQQQFLRLRTKHKNNILKIAFRSDCMLSFPYFSEDVVMEHIDRFSQWEKL